MPIGIGRPGASPITTPSSAPAGVRPATTPAVDIAQPAAPTGAPAAAPSRFDAAVTKLKGKAVAVAMDKTAEEHTLGKDFNVSNYSGNVKISEELGLKGTDSHKKLVEGDRRRTDFEKSNPDAVWVATKGVAGLSAGFPAGAGISVGFNGGMEVTSVMAHDVKGVSDIGAAIKSQAKAMVLPLDAEGLQSLKAAPGSEWMFRGTAGSNVGAGLGYAASTGIPGLGASASVGLNVSASANATYTKNVKVLEDNKVYVQIGRATTEGTGISLGVTAGINVDAASVVSGKAGQLLDKAGNKLEDMTRINASASANASLGQKIVGAAVLDLSTPSGREAYDYIIRSGPSDAVAFMEAQHLGVRYDEASKASSSGITLQFGSANVLSTSTARGTTRGTVEDPGGTTQLAEATFGRSVSGFLARLTMGEERQVSVRAGSVTKNGDTQDAVALNLSVKDTKLTPEELGQLDRYSKAMGTPLEGLAGARTGDKASYAVGVALTDEQVDTLSGFGEPELRLAMASAERDIDGAATLPPYFTEAASFAWYRGKFSDTMADHGGQSPRQAAISEYKAQYGRDLQRDVESAEAIDRVVDRMGDAKGKPVGEWGGVLEALGKAPSNDVRAASLALRRLSGAEVVALTVSVGGQTFAASPEAATPKTLGEIVGPMLAPPA